jgi:tRNA nucleotidyltransferase (CCA-adding enzyme)
VQASPHRTQAHNGTDGARLLAGLAALPGGRELLKVCRTDAHSALVGGAVRDLMLGRAPREIDVVTAGAAEELASSLAALLGEAGHESRITLHERFGTAAVEWDGGRVDIARRRAESYRAPGALPDVREGTILEDLQRRDFTVNAIAITLGGGSAGDTAAAEHALEDLDAGLLRVLHERSFIEDPTRLLRMARYSARLGFAPEPVTASLAELAIGQGALQSVSNARIGAELRLALNEPGALSAMSALGVLGAIGLVLDRERAQAALELLPAGCRTDVLLLACLLPGAADPAVPRQMPELLDSMEFPAAERDVAARAASDARELAVRMGAAGRPSQLMRVVRMREPEEIALAGASGDDAARSAARRWLGSLRDVSLSISGDDLLAAGIPSGPEIGRRLQVVMERRLDGEIPAGRDGELAAALEDR